MNPGGRRYGRKGRGRFGRTCRDPDGKTIAFEIAAGEFGNGRVVLD